MRKTRQVEFSKHFTYLGPLNNTQTVFLAQSKELMRFIVKRIDYGFNMMNMKFSQDNILRKMYASTQPNLLKPQFYSFQNNSLYLAQKIYPMSLQTLILAHRQQRGQISPELVWTFTCKVFDFINKMKQADFYHQNLKPSNIFLEHSESQIKWVISQTGLHTNYRNKYYTKAPAVKNNKSVKIDPVQFQYYSLGVIILEMTTLAKIDQIQQIIRQKKSFYEIEGLDKAKKDYGTALINLALQLLNPKANIKDIFHQFRDEPPRKANMSEITLDAYYKLPQTLDKFCKQNTINILQAAMKDNVKNRQLGCQDLLDYVKKYDPNYEFCFSDLQQSQSFISQYGCRLDLDSLILSSMFYFSMSKFRYMQIALKIFSTQNVVESVIKKALQIYDNTKDFFQAQTQSKDYWKSQQIRNFLWKLGVNVPQNSINQIIKKWTNDSRGDSIKFKQFHAIFKPNNESLMLKKSQSLVKGDSSMHIFEKDTKGVLQQIKAKVPKKNLVSFFRMFDNKQKWVVGYEIEKQIRKYTTVNNIVFKSACEEMWKKAGIPGETSSARQLRYIFLLKILEIYDIVELFRLVITEKINESNRQKFFETYKRGEGWTATSLLQFNNDEMLDFQQREINMIFNLMDQNKSGTIEQKQLVHKLTGLKQFDQQFIITQIKDILKAKRIDLFQIFLKYDPSKNFFLETAKNLTQVFEDIGFDIPFSHSEILYKKFQANYRFQYLMFLRYFYTCKQIFIKACLLIVHHLFRGDFDRLFNIGLQNNQRKWTRKSIDAVNDELVLGFSDMEIGKIWDQLDINGDRSLTKKQIGQIFSIQAQEQDQFKASKVPSYIKPIMEQKNQPNRNSLKNNPLGNLLGVNAISAVGSLVKRSIEQAVIEQVNNNSLLKNLKDTDYLNTLKVFYKKSEFAGWLSFDKFTECLRDMGIKLYQKQLKNGVEKFEYVDERTREKRVNYVKLLLFLSQFSDNPQQTKGKIIIDIFKWVRKDKKYTIAQIFKMCRRNQKMKLSDFESIFKQIVGVQVFYEDLEEAWKLWGQQQYITPQDLQADTVELSSVIKRQFSFNSKEQNYQKRNTFIDEKKDKSIQRKPSVQIQKNIRKINSREVDKKNADSFLPIDSGERYGRRNQRNDDERYRRKQSEDRYGTKKYDSYQNKKQQKSKYRKDSRQQQKYRRDSRQQQRYRRDSRQQQKYRRDSRQQQKYRKDSRQQQRFRRNQRDMQQKKRSIQRDNQQQKYRRNEDERRPYKKYENQRQQQNDKKGQRPSIGQSAQNNKNYLMNLLIGKINDKGNAKINQLFSQSTMISDKVFIRCLVQNYDVDQTEAQQISQILSTFQKIKIQSLKKVLANQKQSSPSAPAHKLKGSEKSPKKKTEFRIDTEQPRYDKRLKDPKKNRINIPMVKQHIKVLVATFCKKFNRAQLQQYFFEGNQQIDREMFISKCEGINPSISRNMLDKIFQYCKPKGQSINTITFGVAFSFDDSIQVDESYLPEQLNNQIKEIFDKFDKDKSGHIDIAEIEQLLNSLGYNETQKEIENCFMQIDKNHDNKIQFHEFRTFIEETVLTQINTFDDEIDNLLNILQMNDIFNTGFLSISTLEAILIRYGIKVNERDVRNLCKIIGNQEEQVSIKDFIQAVNFPSYEIFPTSVKALLYRIRWKKKITLRDIRKVFQSMSSSNFLLAYTSEVLKKKIIKYSTLHQPVLHQSGFYYVDFPYKNIRNISQTEANLVQQTILKNMLIQIKVQQASGLPIPQSSIKSQIRRRYVNIAFYDSSSESLKYAVCYLQAHWDQDVEDQWLFDKVNRSIFIKIGQFQARKYERISILFQFIITIVQDGRQMDISCGYANLPVKQLVGIDGRINKRLKLHAGIPNKSRQIDKTSVSKRSGWLPFMGKGQIQSEVDLQINGPSRFANKIQFLASLPTHSIINRKIIHYVWSFRQYFATKSFNGVRVNPNFSNNFKTKLYLLSFDIPALHTEIVKFWKDKIENYCTTPARSRQVVDIFLQELYQVVYSKQFDYKPSIANHSVLHNTTLHNIRIKMVGEVFDNIFNWIKNNPSGQYTRKKPYSTEFLPFKIQQKQIRPEDLAILKVITNYQVKT